MQFLIILAIATLLSIVWVKGIDDMLINHPNYDGKDFLDENEDK